MKKIILPILVLFLFFSSHAFSQTVQTITVNEAINLAVKNNYQLKVAINRVKLADHRVTGEKADFLPSLSASVNARRSISNQFIPGTNDFVSGSVDRLGATLNSSIVLFSGFANIYSLRNAQYEKKTQKQNVQWTKETIIFNTATAFLQVLLNKELLEIARENLQASLKTLEQVDIQTDVGSRPIVDLYNQQATVANNRLQVTNRENTLELSRLKLVRILQIDPLKEYRFEIPEVNVDEVTAGDYELQQLIATALESRADLQGAVYNIQAIEYQLELAESRYWPTLSFSASIGSGYSPSFVNRLTGEDISFGDQFFDARINKGLGFSLRIPIFSNLDTRTNVQAAKINFKNAKLNLEDTRLQVIQEVKQAYSDYQAILERLQATEAALKAARKAYEAQQARYEVGAGTLIELSQTNAQFVEAKSNRAQAVYSYIFQKRLLDYYIGKLNKNISFN